ncbi:MAG: TRAP transporter small permease [Brevibacillus sp.]|nr:TRAP transporter small permease [Brevibacillus sp.]
MKEVRKLIYTAIKYTNMACLFLMTVLLLIQVFTRKLMNSPLAWPEELSIVTMVWITFFGAYQCTAEDSHLQMGFLKNVASPKVKHIMKVTAKCLVAWFLITINIWAYPFIQKTGSTGMPVTGLPMWVPYGMIWISCMLMLLEVLAQILEEIRKLVSSCKYKHGEEAK